MSWLSRLFSGSGGAAPAARTYSAQSVLDGLSSPETSLAPAGSASGSSAGEEDDDELQAGELIANRFQVQRLLGKGAFGVVYLCSNRSDGRSVAVKLLRRSRVTVEDMQRLRGEARRWVDLGVHPNIVLAYGAAEHSRMPGLSMEYVEGGATLASRIRLHGGDWKSAMWIGAQIAIGLDYAWKKAGMLHRDIKPANILLHPAGIAKIADFGLAMATRVEGGESRGRLGTPYYMAPEIWDGGKIEPAADIYAFGVTIYEAATGHWPFHQQAPRNVEDVARCHRSAMPQDIRQLAPEIPPEFAALVMACLEKDLRKRPKSFETIAKQLNQLTKAKFGHDATGLAPTQTIDKGGLLTNQVSSYLQKGDIKRAKELSEQALRADSGSAIVWTGVASVASAEGRHRDAIKALKKGLDCVPDKGTELKIVADLASESKLAGNVDQARVWLMQAIALAARSNAYSELDGRSDLIAELLSQNEAMQILDRIVQQDPNAAIAWNNRAIFHRRQRNFEEAERSARQAVKVNPQYAKAWTNLANALIEQQRFRDGIEAANRALSIDKKVGGAWVALFGAHMQLGDEDRAIAFLEEGARHCPDHPVIMHNLGIARRGGR